MTRAELIGLVLTKLDEKSPFDEPQSFIAADGDPSYDKVKPIKVYVDDLLDEAANDCLRMLPLSLVGKDVKHEVISDITVTNGVAEIALLYGYVRFVRVRAEGWKKDVTSFITSSDPLYLLQQDEDTRGKLCKPVAAFVPELLRLELYSFPGASKVESVDMHYIPCNKTAGSDSKAPVLSPIDEYIVIRCAELVCNVFGNQQAQVFQKEFTEKINSVLK